MSDDLAKIPDALRLSRRAVATLALWGKIDLVPGLLINEGSALLVMLNGLRLLKG